MAPICISDIEILFNIVRCTTENQLTLNMFESLFEDQDLRDLSLPKSCDIYHVMFHLTYH